MIRIETRLRLLWLTLACATLATALQGCGGGGGGGAAPTPPPPPPPAPAPAESAYLQAEFVAGDSNNQFVRVWDPAQPTVAVQNVHLSFSNGIIWTSSHLVYSDATTYDASTRLVTTLGHAKVYYDNDGKLYSIDLRGGQSHAPVQLSSAVDVFLPHAAVALDRAGDDAWVDVQGGSHDWAIRATMTAASAPVSILALLAPLRDPATGLPQYFVAALGTFAAITDFVPTTFEVADTGFAAVPVPAVTAMASGDGWVGADPAQAGVGYLRIANQLRELHWSASAASVDAGALAPLSAALLPANSVADAQSLYVASGNALLAVAGGVVHTVGTFSVSPDKLVEAGGYVAALEEAPSTSGTIFYAVETLRKADGVRTQLEGSSSNLQLLGATSQGVVMTGTSEQGQAFVVASGDDVTRTTVGAQAVGVVRSASARADQQAAPVALLSCVAGSTDGFCAAGALTQQQLSDGSTSVLGSLAAASAWVRGDVTAGLVGSLAGQSFLSSPGGFGHGQVDRRDAWQLTPAAAGSLTRITSNLP